MESFVMCLHTNFERVRENAKKMCMLQEHEQEEAQGENSGGDGGRW